MAVSPRNNHVTRVQRRNLMNLRRLVSATRPLSFNSPAEYHGVGRGGTQRAFNSGVVQQVKDDEREENHTGDHTDNQAWVERSPKDRRTGRSKNQKRNPASTRFGNPSRNSFHDDTEWSMAPEPAICDETILDQSWDPPAASENCHARPHSEVQSDTSASNPDSALTEISTDLQTRLDMAQHGHGTKKRSTKYENFPKIEDTELHAVERVMEALADSSKNTQYIFRLYRDLPSPGVAYLSERYRGSLLRKFANPPNRRWVDARRYLAIVEDMIAAKLSLSPGLWTSAIHLAGRATGTVKKWDLIRAIGVWQQMEHVGGIKSDHVVFTTLFDISIKAGQFTVADRLLQEMAKRGIVFGRAGKVAMIYYYGLLHDVNGIHRAFDDLISSGEIVDTAVLNCLIISFIRAGEVKTAEQLYQRMMQSQATARHVKAPEYEYDDDPNHQPVLASEFMLYRNKSRELNRVFQKAMHLKKSLPAHHRALQDSVTMSPDTRTFHIFLSYHAYQSGNLNAFKTIMEDMEKSFTMPPRGMIYLLLFEGFARHGKRKKGWTAGKLRLAWRAYLRVLYESRTRLTGDFSFQSPQLTWENPLGGTPVSVPEKSDSSPDRSTTQQPKHDLYTPLPSTMSEARSTSDNNEQGKDKDAELQIEHDPNNAEEILEFDDNVDLEIDNLFLNPTVDEQSATNDMENELRHRIDNGVFLGRRMIIIIIRAFGTVCGPEEVMEAWLSMERIWRPQKRKAVDVQAVREELAKYIQDLN
ncbi:pentatricopeptide repeat protein [Aspergillus clavatus NRRL 1]|uniref:Pentatricopeptide repeat protein n=1 Tax=Aspergillus clavatus (strain ATCC 1007 / CBS 513.65 / DSM 816 / NCTC 3887 / NRRL 1 / QM 1276 / 107) TaxID=344612 RepID=A1CH35_ASPCL|nr:pentatricopeptide repeat protein [Aspergillus clavatus NRRL 1]EAW10190.1 pentatricopeptide repeat protein [Aspergillus clavatus NRRL 1]